MRVLPLPVPMLVMTLLAAAFSPASSASAETDTRLLHASGHVTIDGKPAKAGDAVPYGKTVRTDRHGVAILADGDVRLKLDPASAVRLKAATDTAPLEAELGAGGVIADVKASLARKPRRFQIRTRAAVMGVRGTRFYAALAPSGGKDKDVWMCVNEGEVEIAEVKTGRKVNVTAGLGVQLPAGGSISEPKPYEWTKKLNWNMEPGAGAVENRVEWNSAYGDPLKQNYD